MSKKKKKKKKKTYPSNLDVHSFTSNKSPQGRRKTGREKGSSINFKLSLKG